MGFIKKEENLVQSFENGTISYLLGHSEEMTVVRSTRPAGLTFAPHQHPEAQVYYIVRGKMEITAGDETKMMEEGDTWIIAGDVPHGGRTLEETEEIEVFTPGRPDLAQKYK